LVVENSKWALYSNTCPSGLTNTIPDPLSFILEVPSIYNFQVGSDTGDPIQVYELVGTFVVENG
jgi:hypothetical protein